MNTIQLFSGLLLSLFLLVPSAHATELAVAKPASRSHGDEKAIAHVMKALFDKPGAPLKVAPVSIEGEFALAGWIQNDSGGRAMLKKEGGHWTILVCGGDGLREASALELTGMTKAAAGRLAQKQADAERKLPQDQVRKFAIFGGIVKVEGGAHNHQHSVDLSTTTQKN